jgi:hypothetical protein
MPHREIGQRVKARTRERDSEPMREAESDIKVDYKPGRKSNSILKECTPKYCLKDYCL